MSSPASYQPTVKEVFALVALMGHAGELSNPKLEELAGFRLDGEERRRLNREGLVASTKVGRSHRHQLTDEGWRFCRDLLRQPRPAGAGSAAGALYALLGGLAQGLDRRRLSPVEFFAGSTPAEAAADGAGGDGAGGDGAGGDDAGGAGNGRADLESRIRTAYHHLAKGPGGWVGLADLRALLGPAGRDEVDAALTRMALGPGVHLIPIANLKSLTSADREAALRLGGEDNHAMAIETR